MGVIVTPFDYQRFIFDKSRRSAVLASGCFDILHRGHIRLLERAAQLGSPLIVGLNSDDSIRKLKGPYRPVVPARDRAEVLAALGFVSFVIIFDDLAKLIEEVRPAILVKGADWSEKMTEDRALIEAVGGEIRFLPHEALQSTTKILENYRDRIDLLEAPR